MAVSTPSRLDAAVRAFQAAAWAVLLIAGVEVTIVSTESAVRAQRDLQVGLILFFATLLCWIVLSIRAQPARRRSLLILLGSIMLWAIGSAVLNSDPQPDLSKFPGSGEWFFLAGYAGLAAHLVADGSHQVRRSTSTWLETVIICGGTACLAGSLLTPLAASLHGKGIALLLALLYPLVDIALAILVIAQIALRLRGSLRISGTLVLAFGLMAYADSKFVSDLSSGVYGSSLVNDALYGSAFALIATNACRRPRIADVVPSRRQQPIMLIAGGVAALAVLAVRPPEAVGRYLVIVALVTLLAVGGRLALALREANDATEAFALARSDDLTHLPNRRAVLATLERGLQRPDPMTLMILDLNGFKDVNDTLGHAAGDAVLKIVAHRMRTALDSSIMVARLGGDEFATVTPSVDEIKVVGIAHQILEALREPMTIDGISLSTNASIGITVRSPEDTSSTELLRRADVAMYQAKISRCGALLYDMHHDHFSREKLQISEELRKGILERQLVLWYQPQIEADTQAISGLEALVRWNHPREGLLSPMSFLPAARRAGLMPALSAEVARLATNDMARWRARGLDPRVAINCAPPELLSGIFLPRLYEALEQACIPTSNVVIEVTEDSFINEPERARSVLQGIRAHGMQISIDDYGTGFSSLSYLRDLPVQELKIDRSFITAMRSDSRSQKIVASTLQMAEALGLRTVAEGVEDAATAADLIAMGVDLLQGYHLARPLSPDEVEPWIRRWTSYADVRLSALPGEFGAS